jgi:enterobacterial common antigen flippase
MSLRDSSYRDILRSSAAVGGASLVNVVVGILRTKVLAVLLGPAGVGLMGAYQLIIDLAKSAAHLGINSSGVRQIAETVGSGDRARLARTATVLRAATLACATLGALTVWALSPLVAEATFGSQGRSTEVALLGAAVFFGVVGAGQLALMQGMRRIGDLSKAGIAGSMAGAATTVLLVYWLQERGIVLSLIAVALLSVAIGAWFLSKAGLTRSPVTRAQFSEETALLLKLGLAMMTSNLLALGAAYVARAMVLQHAGLDAAGLYQAAWTLGGLYIGFVLQAMSTDFYPRLVTAIQDSGRSNRLVNEQAQVSLLLAGPGVVGTLALAPLVIGLLYTSEFSGAVETLRWICLGMALRIITWPMGFLLVAANRRLLSVGTDLAWSVFMVAAAWLLIPPLGALGAGIAFFLSYVLHGAMMYPLVRRLYGFRWSFINCKLGAVYLAVIALAMIAASTLSAGWALVVGLALTLLTTVGSLRLLATLVPRESLPGPAARLLRLVGR